MQATPSWEDVDNWHPVGVGKAARLLAGEAERPRLAGWPVACVSIVAQVPGDMGVEKML